MHSVNDDHLSLALLSDKEAEFEEALAETLRNQTGENLLTSLWGKLSRPRKLRIVYALGMTSGKDMYVGLLRRALNATGRGSRDLRCVALMSLAKRQGAAATTDLLAVFASTKDRDIRGYVVSALAFIGDDTAWDVVAAWLEVELQRPGRPGSNPPLAALGFSYLTRHGASSVDRRIHVVRLARLTWPMLDRDERDWFRAHWNQALPGGVEAALVSLPDEEEIRHWVERQPLFRAHGDS